LEVSRNNIKAQKKKKERNVPADVNQIIFILDAYRKEVDKALKNEPNRNK
jgi:hypothetical protein